MDLSRRQTASFNPIFEKTCIRFHTNCLLVNHIRYTS